ncbi:MAG: hypothetical protein Q7K98_06640 [Candidatus Omnitrophota bacterium]|nr:hypothetical protein [Candidatus Omnitrophota bacterium]
MAISIALVVDFKQAFSEENVIAINTLGTEDQPIISLDGNKLCFLYSPMDFEWFQELSPEEKMKILKKEKGIKIIGPYRKGHTENDISNKNIWFRGYCSEKVNGKWTNPTLAPHELIPRDKGIYAKFMTVDNGTRLIVEASGISIDGREIKGEGDLVTFYKQADGTWKGPFILSDYFNTPHMEQDFHVTEDGKTLIFRSDRPGTLGFGDIFISNFENGEWSEPINIGKPINTEDAFEAPGWLSPDKQRIYFVRAYPQPINLKKTGIYFSEKVNGIWAEPIKLDLGIATHKIFAPSLTRDEKELYFELLPQGRKDYQIYVSHKQLDGSWSVAVPVY